MLIKLIINIRGVLFYSLGIYNKITRLTKPIDFIY